MAGDWIKMRGNLWDDPRVSRLVDMTDSSEAAVVGALYWLWATADQHTEDGIMPGLTVKAIDRKTGLQGFGNALVVIGWLADHPEGVRIIKFEEHNGASAKSRCQTARRVSEHKANAKVTQEPLPEQHETVSTALPREEKRREEKKEETPTVFVDKASPSRPPDCPTAEILTRYHERCPMLPRVEVVNDSRKRAMSARWREVVTDPDIRKAESPRDAALEWFDWFFGHVAKSAFLTGKSKDWHADFDFLMTPTKFAKVVEGSYHKEHA